MKKTQNMTRFILLATTLLAYITTTTSCEHKDICFDHDEHALKSDVRIEATYEHEWQYTHQGGTDWKGYDSWTQSLGMAYDDLRPGTPKGLRALVYNEDGTADINNMPAEGGIVPMRPGEHSLLFYNNDTEYIVFDGMHSYASARATTRATTRSSYLGNPHADTEFENTVNAPDMLYGNYMESYTAQRKSEASVLPVSMHPLVFTYLVRYEFSHGLEYVALARGAMAGMAEAVYLNSGRTSEKEATILFDCTVEPFGAQSLVRSFGVPDFPNENYTTRGERKYALNLEVRLKNGQMKSFFFDITNQMAAQPQGGVIVVKDLIVSDEEGTQGGSGFDVDVEDWGEYEDIELPL